MLIAGDSHVRRVRQFSDFMRRKLDRGQVDIDFLYKGGATLHHMESKLDNLAPVDLLVLMIGGNDLGNGATDTAIISSLDRVVRKALDSGFKAVTVTSLWPRQSSQYNRRVFELNKRLENTFSGYNNVHFWSWDRRMSYRTYDGVHLEENGYRKAIKYLLAAVLWSIKHML